MDFLVERKSCLRKLMSILNRKIQGERLQTESSMTVRDIGVLHQHHGALDIKIDFRCYLVILKFANKSRANAGHDLLRTMLTRLHVGLRGAIAKFLLSSCFKFPAKMSTFSSSFRCMTWFEPLPLGFNIHSLRDSLKQTSLLWTPAQKLSCSYGLAS